MRQEFARRVDVPVPNTPVKRITHYSEFRSDLFTADFDSPAYTKDSIRALLQKSILFRQECWPIRFRYEPSVPTDEQDGMSRTRKPLSVVAQPNLVPKDR
jgi:hypothetical protein